MPFHPTLKLLFVHIPKTGGTSLEKYFDMCHAENLWFDRWDRDRELFIKERGHLLNGPGFDFEPQHYPVAILKKLIPDYDDFFKFSFVRHPYTKLLSEYFWSENKVPVKPSDFDPVHFDFWCNVKLNDYEGSHFEPQVNFIDSTIDFVGKYEQFTIDFNRLLSMLFERGFNLPEARSAFLEKTNATGIGKNLLLPLLWRKTKRLIYKTYQQDFKHFGYDR